MAATPGDPRAGAGPGTRSTRRFPTGGQYVEALQNTFVCFRDPELKDGTVARDRVLGPKPISGNFASVFSVTSRAGRRYAVKCFTQDVAAKESRYDAISRHLAALNGAALSQPWNVSFAYQPQGVLVTGEWYPMLKMQWAEGNGLIRWIEDHRTDAAAFATLAARFAELTADLAASGIAHGDLQHGNLLVAADGTFRLVDYDGMFVPALAGYRATEMGHRNYQSPKRSDADFGPDLDRFSTWVIYLALIALSTDMSLWDQLHERDGEFLLLAEEDFQDPAVSPRFGTLLSHPDRGLRELAGRVRDFSLQPLSAVPTLSPGSFPAKSGATKPGATNSAAFAAGPAAYGTAAASPSQPSGSTALPSWLTGHLPPPPPPSAPPMSPPPPSGAGSGPAAPPVAAGGSGFGRRRRIDVVLAAFMLLLVVAPVSLAAASLLAASALPVLQTATLAGAVAAGGLGRRTRPEVRAALARRRDLRRRARALGDPTRALVRLDQEAQSWERQEHERDTGESVRIQQLQGQQHNETARITMALNQRLKSIDAELADLPRREQTRLSGALAPLQQSHIQDRLRLTSIQEARKLPNMGSKSIDALVAAGIRTAADFTGVQYATGGGYGNVTAYFVLSGGRRTRVPGVGEKRARALESWRQDIESRARQTAPAKLSAADLRSLAARTAADRTRLRADRKKAETDAQTQRGQVRQRIAAERRTLTDAQTTARADAARHRAEFAQQRARLTMQQGDRARIDAAISGERAVRRGLAHRRYLRFVLVGR